MTNSEQPKAALPRPRSRKTGTRVLAKANIHLWGEKVGAVMEF